MTNIGYVSVFYSWIHFNTTNFNFVSNGSVYSSMLKRIHGVGKMWRFICKFEWLPSTANLVPYNISSFKSHDSKFIFREILTEATILVVWSHAHNYEHWCTQYICLFSLLDIVRQNNLILLFSYHSACIGVGREMHLKSLFPKYKLVPVVTN